MQIRSGVAKRKRAALAQEEQRREQHHEDQQHQERPHQELQHQEQQHHEDQHHEEQQHEEQGQEQQDDQRKVGRPYSVRCVGLAAADIVAASPTESRIHVTEVPPSCCFCFRPRRRRRCCSIGMLVSIIEESSTRPECKLKDHVVMIVLRPRGRDLYGIFSRLSVFVSRYLCPYLRIVVVATLVLVALRSASETRSISEPALLHILPKSRIAHKVTLPSLFIVFFFFSNPGVAGVDAGSSVPRSLPLPGTRALTAGT